MLLAVAWFSCTSNSEPAPATGGDGARYIDEFAAVLCDLTSQCCAPHGFDAPSDCVARVKAQFQRQLDQYVDGGERFDASAGEQCLAAYRGLAPSCPNTFDFKICHDVFSAGAPRDGGCMGGCAKSEAGATICVAFSSTAADGAVNAGEICQLEMTVGPGQACDPYGHMAVERHCDRSKNSDCVQGICSTPKPIGAPCMVDTNQCTPEAICTAGVCVARVPVGGSCTGSECDALATCEAGKCVVYTNWKKFCAGDFN